MRRVSAEDQPTSRAFAEARSRHGRAGTVGGPRSYDVVTAGAFNLLTSLGLREHHRLLDIGCGPLRIGRLLIPYLEQGRYVGMEPNADALAAGIEMHLDERLRERRRPRLIESADPDRIPDEAPFDFMLAQSVFSHTGRDLLEGWLRGVGRTLATDGALAATYVPGADQDFEGWTQRFVTHSPDTLGALGDRHGLRFTPIAWRHPGQAWALFHKPDFKTEWFGTDPSWNAFVERGFGRPSYESLAEAVCEGSA